MAMPIKCWLTPIRCWKEGPSGPKRGSSFRGSLKSPWPSKVSLGWRLDGQEKVQVRSREKVLGEAGAAGRRERWSVSGGRGKWGSLVPSPNSLHGLSASSHQSPHPSPPRKHTPPGDVVQTQSRITRPQSTFSENGGSAVCWWAAGGAYPKTLGRQC